jgi:acetoacetate decarboxylase
MPTDKTFDALRRHPAWSGLSDEALRAGVDTLVAECSILLVNAGDVVAEYLDDQDVAWLILLGSVDEWSSERRLAIRGIGELTGELAVFAGARDGDSKAVEIVAREEGVLLQIPGQLLRDVATWIPPFATVLLRELARHGMSWSQSADQGLYVITDQVYPWTNPSVFPAPYQANQAELTYIPCQVDRAQMERYVAPDVLGTDFFWLVIARYTGGVGLGTTLQNQVSHYDEVCVMVPAAAQGFLGIYMPWVYVGSAAAMTTGREVFGYPKTLYTPTIDMDNLGLLGQSRVILRKDGNSALTAVWKTLDWTETSSDQRKALADLVLNPFHHPDVHTHIREAIDAAGDEDPRELLKNLMSWEPIVQMGTWKRSFAPSTSLPAQPVVTWSADQFQIDGVALSNMAIQQITEIKPLLLTDMESLNNFIQPGIEPYPLLTVEGLTLGFKLVVDFSIEAGGMLTDYLADPPTLPAELKKLNWGPGAWAPLLEKVPPPSDEE